MFGLDESFSVGSLWGHFGAPFGVAPPAGLWAVCGPCAQKAGSDAAAEAATDSDSTQEPDLPVWFQCVDLF